MKLLFSNHDSTLLAQHQNDTLIADINAMESNRLLNSNADDLVAHFVEKYLLDVPKLLEDQMTVDQREEKRDVSGDPRRVAYHFDRGRPVYVTGTQVTVDIPFSGEPGLFYVRPNTFNTSPPHGTLKNQVLQFEYWSDNPKGRRPAKHSTMKVRLTF